MPLDNDMLLRTGAVDCDAAEPAVVSTTADAYGAKALDVKKTGAKGMVAVMVLPTAPTTYADTLAVTIQASDYMSTDYKTVASFPTLYALNRRLRLVSTTAFVAADIGQTMTGQTTGDTGVLRWYDRALETIGGEGDIIVSMVAADDLFDDASEAVHSGSTGRGTMQKASELTEYLSYGIYAVRFVTSKRYVRASLTPSAGCNFGGILIGIVDDWNFPTTAQ